MDRMRGSGCWWCPIDWLRLLSQLMGGILFLIAAALGKSLLIDGQNAYAHIGEFFFRTNMVIFGQLLETNYYAMVRT